MFLFLFLLVFDSLARNFGKSNRMQGMGEKREIFPIFEELIIHPVNVIAIESDWNT